MVEDYTNVEVLNWTENPEDVIWKAMHTDYSPDFVGADYPVPSDVRQSIVVNLLKGNRGHYGPLEHPQISFAVGGFSHAMMQQARTHRVGISFDVQSFRYTGQQLHAAAKAIEYEKEWDCVYTGREVPSAIRRIIDKVFRIPETLVNGRAKTRQGMKDFIYPNVTRNLFYLQCLGQLLIYKQMVDNGVPYEDARSIIGYAVRQNFMVSFNMRSLMHFLDLRAKSDAQGEIQEVCVKMMEYFEAWCPSVAEWYKSSRWAKARLSP